MGDFKFASDYGPDNYNPSQLFGPDLYNYRDRYNAAFAALNSGTLVGKGVFTLPERGHTFDFDFKDGYYASGKSIAIHPDGGFYKGDLANGMPKYGGYGLYIYPDGSEYYGQWDVGGPSDLDELRKYDPYYYMAVLSRGYRF